MNRNNLRRTRLVERDQLKPAQRRKRNSRIFARLTEIFLLTAAEHFFVYVNFRSEVESIQLINQLIAAGKTVSVPVTLLSESSLSAVRLTDPEAQLEPGCFGVPEPTKERVGQATVDPASIDIAIIPGSVFDQIGGRLGYGGGFYDRFLTQKAPQATRIALAYEMQMTEQVPMQAHDQYMDMIITERQVYDCRQNRLQKDS